MPSSKVVVPPPSPQGDNSECLEQGQDVVEEIVGPHSAKGP